MASKTNKTYWKAKNPKTGKPRIQRRAYQTDNGEVKQTSEYSARMTGPCGTRRWVKLESSDFDKAARKAAEKYTILLKEGWAGLNGDKDQIPLNQITIQDFMERIKRVSRVSPRTWGNYEQGFRQLVGEVNGITSPPNSGKGRMKLIEEWKSSVGEIKLSSVTRARVEAWMKDYVDRRTGGPDEKRHAKNSANSILAKAKPFFNEERLELAGMGELENPLGKVKPYPSASRRYVSKFNVVTLILEAEEKLSGKPGTSEHEMFKLLILLGFTGIRRKDADLLLWEQIDLESGFIDLRRTKYFEPKSEYTLRRIDLDPDAVSFLRGFREEDPDSEFFLEGGEPILDVSYAHYRGGKIQDGLIEWLRKYEEDGVMPFADKKIKPLHTIRKEIGAMIASQAGIFAASRYLGHANIAITNQYYSDQKNRVTAGVSLSGQAKEP